jgi:hypothetical protein
VAGFGRGCALPLADPFGIAELNKLNKKQARNFQNYLRKHSSRIPDYQLYQELGICIGSGSVESWIKQIGSRIKIIGAQWNQKNVPQILKLRCAYLGLAEKVIEE